MVTALDSRQRGTAGPGARRGRARGSSREGRANGGGGNGVPARLCAEQDLQGYRLIWGRLWVKSLIKANMWTEDGLAGPPGKL